MREGRGRFVLEGIRFAADVASNPSGVVTLWKAATGGKAIGCLPATSVPELPHAAGLLPVPLESPRDRSLFAGRVDAWLVGADAPHPPADPRAGIPRFAFPTVPPGTLEEALDRVEALAEWAGGVSGTPASEGGLWKSIGAYATRRSLLDALEERIAREPSFLTPAGHRDVVRAGAFLPPEAHTRLLAAILDVDPDQGALPAGGERGDPLIVLAKRLV